MNPRTWRLVSRWLWLCPVLSVALAAALPFVLGVRLLTAVLMAVLLACPISAAWVLVAERLGRRQARDGSGEGD